MKRWILSCMFFLALSSIYLGEDHAIGDEMPPDKEKTHDGLNDFESAYVNFILSHSYNKPLSVSNLANWKTGDAGDIEIGRASVQVVGKTSMLVTTLHPVSTRPAFSGKASPVDVYNRIQSGISSEPVYELGETIWIDGIDTKDFVDGDRIVKFSDDVAFVVVPSTTYPTAAGGTNTVKRITAVSQSKLAPVIERLLQEQGVRTWTDQDGHSLRASYIVGGTVVKLQLLNGDTLEVAKKFLSDSDQKWLREELIRRRNIGQQKNSLP